MAYTAPSVDDFRERYPEFDDTTYSDEVVEAALLRAGRSVDNTWFEGDYATAIMALTGHLIAVSGFAGESLGQDEIKSISIGPLSLTFGKAISMADWSSSPYGQEYKLLLRKNIPAVVII